MSSKGTVSRVGQEATARNIPKETSDKHPDILWEKMVSMRNKVIHEYLNVDLEILWKTIHEDLPPLKEQIKSLPELADS